MEQALTDTEETRVKEVPAFYASGINLAVSGTDMKVVFTDVRPVIEVDGKVGSESAMEPCAVLTMSFHTAKDLCAIISHALSRLESDLGDINTAFSMKQAPQSRNGSK